VALTKQSGWVKIGCAYVLVASSERRDDETRCGVDYFLWGYGLGYSRGYFICKGVPGVSLHSMLASLGG